MFKLLHSMFAPYARQVCESAVGTNVVPAMAQKWRHPHSPGTQLRGQSRLSTDHDDFEALQLHYDYKVSGSSHIDFPIFTL